MRGAVALVTSGGPSRSDLRPHPPRLCWLVSTGNTACTALRPRQPGFDGFRAMPLDVGARGFPCPPPQSVRTGQCFRLRRGAGGSAARPSGSGRPMWGGRCFSRSVTSSPPSQGRELPPWSGPACQFCPHGRSVLPGRRPQRGAARAAFSEPCARLSHAGRSPAAGSRVRAERGAGRGGAVGRSPHGAVLRGWSLSLLAAWTQGSVGPRGRGGAGGAGRWCVCWPVPPEIDLGQPGTVGPGGGRRSGVWVGYTLQRHPPPGGVGWGSHRVGRDAPGRWTKQEIWGPGLGTPVVRAGREGRKGAAVRGADPGCPGSPEAGRPGAVWDRPVHV